MQTENLILESGPVLAVVSVSVQSLHTVLHGLESDTVYYYSIVGTNTAGRSESAVMSFRTNQISSKYIIMNNYYKYVIVTKFLINFITTNYSFNPLKFIST